MLRRVLASAAVSRHCCLPVRRAARHVRKQFEPPSPLAGLRQPVASGRLSAADYFLSSLGSTTDGHLGRYIDEDTLQLIRERHIQPLYKPEYMYLAQRQAKEVGLGRGVVDRSCCGVRLALSADFPCPL
jgi:hypothetical protein